MASLRPLKVDMEMVLVDPSPIEWTKVKNTKGKKCRIEEYFIS